MLCLRKKYLKINRKNNAQQNNSMVTHTHIHTNTYIQKFPITAGLKSLLTW